MSSGLKLAGLCLGLLLLHTVLNTLFPDALAPDLMLVLALALGLRSAGTTALILAFLLGFCVDALSGSPLGLYAMLRGTACAATRLFDRALYLRGPLPWSIYVAVFVIVDQLEMAWVLRALAPEGALPWAVLLRSAPGSALPTALLAAPVLWAMRRVESETPRERGWASLASRART